MSTTFVREFNLELFDKTVNAEFSQEAAKDLLLEIAEILGEGQPLPIGVSEWLACAIEGALNHPENYTHKSDLNCDIGQALLTALGLRNNNRRQGADRVEVWSYMKGVMDNDNCSQNQAAEGAAGKFGIGKTTAHTCYRECEKSVSHLNIPGTE